MNGIVIFNADSGMPVFVRSFAARFGLDVSAATQAVINGNDGRWCGYSSNPTATEENFARLSSLSMPLYALYRSSESVVSGSSEKQESSVDARGDWEIPESSESVEESDSKPTLQAFWTSNAYLMFRILPLVNIKCRLLVVVSFHPDIGKKSFNKLLNLILSTISSVLDRNSRTTTVQNMLPEKISRRLDNGLTKIFTDFTLTLLSEAVAEYCSSVGIEQNESVSCHIESILTMFIPDSHKEIGRKRVTVKINENFITKQKKEHKSEPKTLPNATRVPSLALDRIAAIPKDPTSTPLPLNETTRLEMVSPREIFLPPESTRKEENAPSVVADTAETVQAVPRPACDSPLVRARGPPPLPSPPPPLPPPMQDMNFDDESLEFRRGSLNISVVQNGEEESTNEAILVLPHTKPYHLNPQPDYHVKLQTKCVMTDGTVTNNLGDSKWISFQRVVERQQNWRKWLCGCIRYQSPDAFSSLLEVSTEWLESGFRCAYWTAAKSSSIVFTTDIVPLIRLLFAAGMSIHSYESHIDSSIPKDNGQSFLHAGKNTDFEDLVIEIGTKSSGFRHILKRGNALILLHTPAANQIHNVNMKQLANIFAPLLTWQEFMHYYRFE